MIASEGTNEVLLIGYNGDCRNNTDISIGDNDMSEVNIIKKTIKVGTTRKMERVTIDIVLTQRFCKEKNINGGWTDNPFFLYIYGSVVFNNKQISYGQNIPEIEEWLHNDDFLFLYHTKEYIQSLIDIWKEYHLNGYTRHCMHQTVNTLKGAVCPFCNHKMGDPVLKVIPEKTLSILLKTDWERKKDYKEEQKKEAEQCSM